MKSQSTKPGSALREQAISQWPLPRPRRRRRPLLWLFGSSLLWLILWGPYVGTTLGLFGNCGEPTWVGRAGNWHGGPYESGLTAGVVGVALWVAAAVTAWRLREHRKLIVWGSTLLFAAIYGVALSILWYVVSPAIWGDTQCVIPH